MQMKTNTRRLVQKEETPRVGQAAFQLESSEKTSSDASGAASLRHKLTGESRVRADFHFLRATRMDKHQRCVATPFQGRLTSISGGSAAFFSFQRDRVGAADLLAGMQVRRVVFVACS